MMKAIGWVSKGSHCWDQQSVGPLMEATYKVTSDVTRGGWNVICGWTCSCSRWVAPSTSIGGASEAFNMRVTMPTQAHLPLPEGATVFCPVFCYNLPHNAIFCPILAYFALFCRNMPYFAITFTQFDIFLTYPSAPFCHIFCPILPYSPRLPKSAQFCSI
jgi:hypothetical protein